MAVTTKASATDKTDKDEKSFNHALWILPTVAVGGIAAAVYFVLRRKKLISAVTKSVGTAQPDEGNIMDSGIETEMPEEPKENTEEDNSEDNSPKE